MKIMSNFSSSSDDLQRYQNQGEFLAQFADFDGVELLYLEEDKRRIIPPEKVIGLHLRAIPNWLSFWLGDEQALKEEFGSREVWESYYGGKDKEALLKPIREDLQKAHTYDAEYVVFHISDAAVGEAPSGVFRRSDEEVIDASCELLNEAFAHCDKKIVLLLENLWQPGLRFTEPALTKRQLDGIQHPNKGLMLDTGHLFHTNTALRSEAEGLAYIHRLLDRHGELCAAIRGVHLQQSLTGAYAEALKRNPPAWESDFYARCMQMFEYAFAVDKHLPFTAKGIEALIERIKPEYLTFEFISQNRAEQRRMLDSQWAALPNLHKQRR